MLLFLTAGTFSGPIQHTQNFVVIFIKKSLICTQVITKEMESFIGDLRNKVVIAVVGGSDLVKIKEQMGGESC